MDGLEYSAKGMSSNPMIFASRGTTMPWSANSLSAPIAMVSARHNTPSEPSHRSPGTRFSSSAAACRPPSSVHTHMMHWSRSKASPCSSSTRAIAARRLGPKPLPLARAAS